MTRRAARRGLEHAPREEVTHWDVHAQRVALLAAAPWRKAGVALLAGEFFPALVRSAAPPRAGRRMHSPRASVAHHTHQHRALAHNPSHGGAAAHAGNEFE